MKRNIRSGAKGVSSLIVVVAPIPSAQQNAAAQAIRPAQETRERCTGKAERSRRGGTLGKSSETQRAGESGNGNAKERSPKRIQTATSQIWGAGDCCTSAVALVHQGNTALKPTRGYDHLDELPQGFAVCKVAQTDEHTHRKIHTHHLHCVSTWQTSQPILSLGTPTLAVHLLADICQTEADIQTST